MKPDLKTSYLQDLDKPWLSHFIKLAWSLMYPPGASEVPIFRGLGVFLWTS